MSSYSSVNAMAEERTFQCPDGVTLAYRVYGGRSNYDDSSKTQESNSDDKYRRNVLCLHGWLDNAATFDLIAPNLIQKGYASEVVALDFPGHGLSGHKSNDGPVQVMAEYAYYVAETLRALGWNFETRKDTTTSTDGANDNCNGVISQSPVLTLMGHSMGAGVAMMYTSAFPEQIESLVLLEGFAPLARPATDASKHLRQAISTRLTYNPRLFPQNTSTAKQQTDKEKATAAASSDTVAASNPGNGNAVVNTGTSMGRIYPSIEVAIQSRQQTPRLCPGNQYMSYEAARRLVERATVPASTASSENETSDTKKPVRFRHDTRLNWPSLMYMGHEQVQSLLETVQTSKVPVCLLQAQDGWPVDNKAKHAVNDILKPSFLRSDIKGSHHFHVDPDNAPEVLDKIAEFFDTLTISSTTPASSNIEGTNNAAPSTQSSSAL